jgi:hypothetical protein
VSRAQTTKTGVFGVLFSRKDPFEGLRYGNACTELPRLRHADRGAMDYGWIHCYVTRMKKFLTRSTLKTGSVILYFCLDHHVDECYFSACKHIFASVMLRSRL